MNDTCVNKAAILETVGFEPTPQFLQNRFKEKIADRSAAYTDLFLMLPLHHVSIEKRFSFGLYPIQVVVLRINPQRTLLAAATWNGANFLVQNNLKYCFI